MKSVLQAAWLLTVAFGNLIVIVVAQFKMLNQVRTQDQRSFKLHYVFSSCQHLFRH